MNGLLIFTFGTDPHVGDAAEKRDLRRRAGHFFASLYKLIEIISNKRSFEF